MDIRLSILNILMPITKTIGKIHMPFTHTKLTGKHFYSLCLALQPGYVLLSRKRGELSNLAIPGEFTHAAIACENSTEIIQATGAGVHETELLTYMMPKDRIVVLKATFCSKEVSAYAAQVANSFIGHPYDYLFQPDTKAFFCSELVQKCYEIAAGIIPFVPRERFGKQTVIPQDFYDSAKSKNPKWEIVWDSKELS
jgi:cell wall-associated NlpC family hydrolase